MYYQSSKKTKALISFVVTAKLIFVLHVAVCSIIILHDKVSSMKMGQIDK